MKLQSHNLTIRPVTLEDAAVLTRWWNDGQLMKYVGFPQGLNISLAETKDTIRSWQGKKSRFCLIELDGQPIGECNISYQPDSTSAYPGWKIAEQSQRNQGIGRRVMLMLFDYIFQDPAIETIVWDTLADNEPARHIYETKMGLSAAELPAWTDPEGNQRSVVGYTIDRTDLARIKQTLSSD